MPIHLIMSHLPWGRDFHRLGAYRAEHTYYGVEWAMEGMRLPVAHARLERMLAQMRAAAPQASYHAPYSDVEIAHRDPAIGQASMDSLKRYIDAIAPIGAHHLNCHVGSFGLGPDERSWDRMVSNVREIAAYGEARGLIVTIENLQEGLSSEPDLFCRLVTETGIRVTFDIGHANGSDWVCSGRGTAAEFIRRLGGCIVAAHVYEIEADDTHHAPRDLSRIGAALSELSRVGCDWWVLELPRLDLLEATRNVVDRFVAEQEGLQGLLGHGRVG